MSRDDPEELTEEEQVWEDGEEAIDEMEQRQEQSADEDARRDEEGGSDDEY